MEHDDARDGRANFETAFFDINLFLELLLDGGSLTFCEFTKVFVSPWRKENDEEWKADEDGELKEDLASVAEEDFIATA